ncbi:MAG: hypothetical protein ACK4R2_12340 [Roseateles sp.]
MHNPPVTASADHRPITRMLRPRQQGDQTALATLLDGADGVDDEWSMPLRVHTAQPSAPSRRYLDSAGLGLAVSGPHPPACA